MNKIVRLCLTILFMFCLIGCGKKSMNDIINSEPNITGIVKEVNENSILIENENGQYWVSLNVENKDSVTNFNIGDEVVVYYDGMVAESYPMQIKEVYAIALKTPANRAENNKS